MAILRSAVATVLPLALNWQEVQATRAPNALPTVNAALNPALTNETLFGHLAEIAFDKIFIMCFNKTCASHSPDGDPNHGRVWWPSIQERVLTFDGRELDRQNSRVMQFAGCDSHRCPVSAEKLKRATGHKHELVQWRDHSKHRMAVLLSHLTMVEHAAKLNLTSVLILEADFVRAAISEKYVGSASKYPASLSVARRMRDALANYQWSIARFSIGIPGMPTTRVNNHTTCHSSCVCREWNGSSHVNVSHPKLCMVEPAAYTSFNASTMPPITRAAPMCDLRDSSAYAVHRSAFPAFVAILQELRSLPEWLRNDTFDVPHIDIWLPHYFRNLYVLPPLIAQQSRTINGAGIGGQRNGMTFAHLCYEAKLNRSKAFRSDSEPVPSEIGELETVRLESLPAEGSSTASSNSVDGPATARQY